MKKTLMATLMAAALAVSLFAHGHGGRGRHDWHERHGEWAVPQASLPQAAEDFIGAYFPDSSVQFAGGNARICKVALSDGTEIAFAPDGSWRGIKSYAGVPLEVLPQGAAESARELYPDVPILKAEKDWRGYELRLANRMAMFFDADGRLLGQKLEH